MVVANYATHRNPMQQQHEGVRLSTMDGVRACSDAALVEEAIGLLSCKVTRAERRLFRGSSNGGAGSREYRMLIVRRM